MVVPDTKPVLEFTHQAVVEKEVAWESIRMIDAQHVRLGGFRVYQPSAPVAVVRSFRDETAKRPTLYPDRIVVIDSDRQPCRLEQD